ncbi:tripartite tricarboxylate transporter TctB family protein [Paracoccus sp. Z330]|uniref:Tripartite tricarboxylate transporter TctB family protein n=1 Tax=Paracoccus onchidii TaxID=3017813 RepID=A0ABT4ZJD5_9RHOB|nr:tripartite tricarboxylate transporter TctB family protein [Paracoccus onchidii]MDB6179177.1 tripartite tricarboxylate transporter TctB family protein [Paracoccus onchidii]
MLRTDRIVGGIAILVAVFFIWRTTLIEIPFISDPLGPKTFPVIICAVLALAGLGVMLKPDAEPNWPKLSGFMEVGLGVVVFIAYAELLPVLGFIIATFFAGGILAWRLGAPPVQAAIAGIGISLGIYAVFHLALGLTLAVGPLGF